MFIAIDLKSFYASVECVERGFDPLTTNLVVADESRTEKTICLAVSPSLKAYGISGRARLFEVVARVKEVNRERLKKCRGHFSRDSYNDLEVRSDPSVALNYYVAAPRMSHYMKYSSKIYSIYLRYVSKEDIHVYSIDEVFIDVSSYLNTYKMSARELANKMVREVLSETGITATCGIGTNMYLAKVAMDIVAKRMEPDANGVRLAELDEMSYRKQLWEHEPLTDFWRVGRGISNRLMKLGIKTMGDLARQSLLDEEVLYKAFGINAELLIDHAWGYESCTIKDIRSYVPVNNSLTTGQVLKEPYSYEKGLLIVKEMTELLVLDMVDKQVVCDQLVLNVGYDNSSLNNYEGEISYDPYGRPMPKAAHGSINLSGYTVSRKEIMDAITRLYSQITDASLTIRRMSVVANHIKKESEAPEEMVQFDLFSDPELLDKRKKELKREKKAEIAINAIKRKYGKNAILKANNLEEGATTIERNGQIGGHKG